MVVGVRTSFPCSLEEEASEESFDVPSPVLVIGLQFPYSWSKGDVHFVCWRPCGFERSYVCESCDLNNDSFLKPGWLKSETTPLSTDNLVLQGFDSGMIESQRMPDGLTEPNLTSILQCMDELKRRCLKGLDPDHVDRKLCLENAEKGEFRSALNGRSLPSFEDFFVHACGQISKTTQTVRTRKIRNTDEDDDEAMKVLSEIHFLPPWSSAKDGTVSLRPARQETRMPFPCLCLELVCLRIKSGYYRQPAAIVNDLTEAYVTTVLYLLSEPASRKKQRLSIHKVSKFLYSTTKEASNEFLEGYSDEERSWITKVEKIRQLYSMVCCK